MKEEQIKMAGITRKWRDYQPTNQPTRRYYVRREEVVPSSDYVRREEVVPSSDKYKEVASMNART